MGNTELVRGEPLGERLERLRPGKRLSDTGRFGWGTPIQHRQAGGQDGRRVAQPVGESANSLIPLYMGSPYRTGTDTYAQVLARGTRGLES